jgi:hypothetical protein
LTCVGSVPDIDGGAEGVTSECHAITVRGGGCQRPSTEKPRFFRGTEERLPRQLAREEAAHLGQARPRTQLAGVRLQKAPRGLAGRPRL